MAARNVAHPRARRAALVEGAAPPTAALALLLLLALPAGAQAQEQQQQQQQAEPVPAAFGASGNRIVTGRRDDAAAIAVVREKMTEPLPARRGCATPDPTPEQIGAAAEAVLALRAQRAAMGELPSAAALKQSLVGAPPTVVQTYFHVVYPVAKAADVEKLFPNGTYGGDGEFRCSSFVCGPLPPHRSEHKTKTERKNFAASPPPPPPPTS